MKLLLLSTFEQSGGAAIACNRLMHALIKNDVNAKMLVRDKQTADEHVFSVNPGFTKWMNKFRFIWERFVIWINNGFSRKNLFAVSIANTGMDISHHPLVKEADIIHLHWINQGFLSLKDIKKLTKLGKPVVWTMHDMWPSTSICHHSRQCDKYHSHCINCFFLKGEKQKDISYKIFNRKRDLYAGIKINFVTCSRWLQNRADNSALLNHQNVRAIPNAIDIEKYYPIDKVSARKLLQIQAHKQKFILFGSAKITDKRKGIDYFIKSCERLLALDPEVKKQVGIITFGNNSDELADKIAFDVYPLNYISELETIRNLYSAVDVFVIPSLEENLPNTIMEAMACGTPCVGFNVGGIPEMIDHQKNGYVAQYENAEDLAHGIYWVLKESNYDELAQNARKKVVETYSEDVVAKQYISLYKSLVN